MRAREPVGLHRREPAHLVGGGRLALVVPQGQGVQPGDLDVAVGALVTRAFHEPVVPDPGRVELALVQKYPGDMIEALQTFAVVTAYRLAAERLKRPEIRRAGPPFDSLCQLKGRPRLRRRLS